MPIFRARFSVKTDKTTIHADSCSAAVGKGTAGRWTHKSGDAIWQVDAASASDAAYRVYVGEDMEHRGLPRPTCCACTRP
jgi:hypothetical protein